MRVFAGILGALLVALMLSEFFVVFMLPRRVRRDPYIARGLTRLFWTPWKAFAQRLAPSSADTMLGIFGGGQEGLGLLEGHRLRRASRLAGGQLAQERDVALDAVAGHLAPYRPPQDGQHFAHGGGADRRGLLGEPSVHVVR